MTVTTSPGAPSACAGETSYELAGDGGPLPAACSRDGAELAFRLELAGVASFELAAGGTFSEWNARTGLLTAGVCSPSSGELAGELECLDASGACSVRVRYELADCP